MNATDEQKEAANRLAHACYGNTFSVILKACRDELAAFASRCVEEAEAKAEFDRETISNLQIIFNKSQADLAQVQKERDEARKELLDLKYASAESLTYAYLVKSNATNYDRAEAAEARESKALAAAVELRKALILQVAENKMREKARHDALASTAWVEEMP